MTSGGFKTRHLAVVGLGLMGGSLALALRGHAERITGIELNAESRRYAVDNKIVDAATDDLKAGVSDADTVILAAPVRMIQQMVEQRIGSYLRSNTLLIDIGGTKKDICEVMGRLPVGIHAIGGHPMTGKELSGVQASDGSIYKGRPFVLCPTRRTTPATRSTRSIGLRTRSASPRRSRTRSGEHVSSPDSASAPANCAPPELPRIPRGRAPGGQSRTEPQEGR